MQQMPAISGRLTGLELQPERARRRSLDGRLRRQPVGDRLLQFLHKKDVTHLNVRPLLLK